MKGSVKRRLEDKMTRWKYCLPAFPPFSIMFQKLSSLGLLKMQDYLVYGVKKPQLQFNKWMTTEIPETNCSYQHFERTYQQYAAAWIIEFCNISEAFLPGI